MAEQKKQKRHGDEKANKKAGLNLPKCKVQTKEIVFALKHLAESVHKQFLFGRVFVCCQAWQSIRKASPPGDRCIS